MFFFLKTAIIFAAATDMYTFFNPQENTHAAIFHYLCPNHSLTQ